MAEARTEYRAVNVIGFNDVRAYNPGDPVDCRAVQGGSEWGWIDPGDVEPSGVIAPPRPPLNASQQLWALYAEGQGADPDEAQGMTRSQLIELYGQDEGAALTAPDEAAEAAEEEGS